MSKVEGSCEITELFSLRGSSTPLLMTAHKIVLVIMLVLDIFVFRLRLRARA